MPEIKVLDLKTIDSYEQHIELDLDLLCQKILDQSLILAHIDGFAFVRMILLALGGTYHLTNTRRKMKLYSYLLNNLTKEQVSALRDPDSLYDDKDNDNE